MLRERLLGGLDQLGVLLLVLLVRHMRRLVLLVVVQAVRDAGGQGAPAQELSIGVGEYEGVFR